MDSYVLRIKGLKRGYIFYDYLEDTVLDGVYKGCTTIGCERFRYAHEFETLEEAEEFKNKYDTADNMEVVSYSVASEEYNKGDE